MSASAPKATVCHQAPNLSLSVISRHMQRNKTASLFDHLVGAGEQHWRHVKQECSRGFEIDDQLERRRLENR